MPNYLGTATGNTGIPSLLISSLSQVQDPNIQKALYEIQNWANSFVPLQHALNIQDAGGALRGSLPNGITSFIFGSDVQTTSGGGGAVTFFPTAFPNGVATVVANYGDNGYLGGAMGVIAAQVQLDRFGWEAQGAASIPVRINYIAAGG